MATNVYIQDYADGTSQRVRRSIKQGRVPQGLAEPKLYRLKLDTVARMQIIKEKLGYLYNENELVRNAVEYYLNNIYTDLLKP